MSIGLIFMKLCNRSLMATYCIGAVILLRLLLRRQPKIFSYLLWSVVLFRQRKIVKCVCKLLKKKMQRIEVLFSNATHHDSHHTLSRIVI